MKLASACALLLAGCLVVRPIVPKRPLVIVNVPAGGMSLQTHPTGLVPIEAQVRGVSDGLEVGLTLSGGGSATDRAFSADSDATVLWEAPANVRGEVAIGLRAVDSLQRELLNEDRSISVDTVIEVVCTPAFVLGGGSATCTAKNAGTPIAVSWSAVGGVISSAVSATAQVTLPASPTALGVNASAGSYSGGALVTVLAAPVPPIISGAAIVTAGDTNVRYDFTNASAGLTYACTSSGVTIVTTASDHVLVDIGATAGSAALDCTSTNAAATSAATHFTLAIAPAPVSPTIAAPLFLTSNTGNNRRDFVAPNAALTYSCMTSGALTLDQTAADHVLLSAGAAGLSATLSCRATNAAGRASAYTMTSFTNLPPPLVTIHAPPKLTSGHTGVKIAVTAPGPLLCNVGAGLTLTATNADHIVLTVGAVGLARSISCSAPNPAGDSDSDSVTVDVVGGAYVELLAGACSTTPVALSVDDTVFTEVRFRDPRMVAVDRYGDAYVTDYEGNAVRRVRPNGATNTVAGVLNNAGTTDGAFGVGTMTRPVAIALHQASGSLLVSEEGSSSSWRVLRRLKPNGVGQFSTERILGNGMEGCVAGNGTTAKFKSFWGLVFADDNTLYAADRFASIVMRIDLSPGWPSAATVAPSAISASIFGGVCNMGGTAAMGHMRAAGGLYYDAGTTVAVSVDGSDLRRVTPPNTISEYCAAAACGLTFPRDVLRTASGKVYVADTDGDRIVELTNPVAPVVVAGMSGSASVVADVAIASARFTGPSGIAMDPYGDLIVVDHDSHCVLRVRF